MLSISITVFYLTLANFRYKIIMFWDINYNKLLQARMKRRYKLNISLFYKIYLFFSITNWI